MSAKPQLTPLSLPEDRNTSTEQPLASNNETVESSTSEAIAQLAYTLWQQRGCPVGSAEIDWINAQQQLSR